MVGNINEIRSRYFIKVPGENMLAKAISLTGELFRNVVDKGGKPYMLHCIFVMNGVRHLGQDVMTAAVLHDVVEDTDITYDDLIRMGYNQRVCYILTFLTHDKEKDTYDEYIQKMIDCIEAMKIKKVDLEHNSSITRLKKIDPDKTNKQIAKYHKSYQFLEIEIEKFI